MKLENPWIGYLDRSYKQVKASLIKRLQVYAPEITDHSESNILIIILSMFAGVAEVLNLYIDNVARESFLSTCRKFSSAYKLTRILDYRIKAFLAANVDLYFTYVDDDGNPVITTEIGIIPSGTLVTTLNDVQFLTIKAIEVGIGASYGISPAKQWEKQSNIQIGITTNLPNQKYTIPGQYVHNSIELRVDGQNWDLKETLARSLSNDKHFIVDVDEYQIPQVIFGNGLNGEIPVGNKDIVIDYYITDGADSNTLSANTITQLGDTLVLPFPATGVIVRNPLEPNGAADIEGVEQIRVNAPLTIKTLQRAVTRPDFKDLAVQADGVAKANVIYECGVEVNIYIAPNGGNVASQALLDEVKDYMDGLKILNRRIITKAAGITPVVIKATIKARFRADKVQTKIDAEQALTKAFSFDSQDINGRVAMSDVISTIDNLTRVDTVEIDGLYTLPYPFKVNTNIDLNWQRDTLPTSNETATWRLVYTGTDFRVLYNEGYLANINVNQQYTDPKALITFKVLDSAYSPGDVWEFTSYPYNKTIKMTDNTVPIIVGAQTTLITVI